MSEQPELWQALLPVVDALDSLKVDYYIGGSVASSFTGVARATQDADLIADLRPAHALLLTASLEEAYYVSRDRMIQAIRRRSSFNVIHLATMFKVDVFVMPRSSYARRSMARRTSLEIPEVGRPLDFCAPEDIVLSKLDWYRLGGEVSDRQWYDLQGVLRLQSENLDLDYLRSWARQLGLETLLERALSELGP